ncbi:MAG TPA: 3-phosphoshikimate 1-carboxyvinyltransferase [Pirellulaceae bacterium]|nr:3-phosphoshikimate 1-carboxyvinyltransferase [Pirellulaceae bacterium]
MSDEIAITPCGPIHGSIRPPGSKSITNRALVCAALAEGRSTLTGALDSEDTRVMIESLGRLGIAAQSFDGGTRLEVDGCGGKIPAEKADLFVGNSGTTIRFLTAMVALGHGTYRLSGIPRMHQRPIGDLAEALRQLGADVFCESPNGCPPVVVRASGLRGGTAGIRGDISSQFLSAVLMAAPLAAQPVSMAIEGKLVSVPYVVMTSEVMAAFGVGGAYKPSGFYMHAPQPYRGTNYTIEPDASAASYFWGAAAITGGRVTVEGLSWKNIQGDVKFVDCLELMGCSVSKDHESITVEGRRLRGIDIDMNAISDTVQTLAVVALFAEGPTTIRNVAHIRHKETDRIGDLARELRKLGATVEERADGLTITPGPLRGAAIDTYNDHRMAMSFSLAGLKLPGVTIRDPGCTAKTYPAYFQDLSRLVGTRFQTY